MEEQQSVVNEKEFPYQIPVGRQRDKFACPICKKQKQLQHWKDHVLVCQNRKQKSLKPSNISCPVCKKFYPQKYLNQHVKRVHQQDIRERTNKRMPRFKCKHCQKKISIKSRRSHFKRKHYDIFVKQGVTVECPICEKVVNILNIKYHQKTHEVQNKIEFKKRPLSFKKCNVGANTSCLPLNSSVLGMHCMIYFLLNKKVTWHSLTSNFASLIKKVKNGQSYLPDIQSALDYLTCAGFIKQADMEKEKRKINKHHQPICPLPRRIYQTSDLFWDKDEINFYQDCEGTTQKQRKKDIQEEGQFQIKDPIKMQQENVYEMERKLKDMQKDFKKDYFFQWESKTQIQNFDPLIKMERNITKIKNCIEDLEGNLMFSLVMIDQMKAERRYFRKMRSHFEPSFKFKEMSMYLRSDPVFLKVMNQQLKASQP